MGVAHVRFFVLLKLLLNFHYVLTLFLPFFFNDKMLVHFVLSFTFSEFKVCLFTLIKFVWL